MVLQICVQFLDPLSHNVPSALEPRRLKTDQPLFLCPLCFCAALCSRLFLQASRSRLSRETVAAAAAATSPLLFLSSLFLSHTHCFARSTPASSFTLSLLLPPPSFLSSCCLSLRLSSHWLIHRPIRRLKHKPTDAVFGCSPESANIRAWWQITNILCELSSSLLFCNNSSPFKHVLLESLSLKTILPVLVCGWTLCFKYFPSFHKTKREREYKRQKKKNRKYTYVVNSWS